MKVVTLYEASDGKRFHDKEKCEQYERNGCVEFMPLPDYGDHSPITDQSALHWALMGDGSGYYATETQMTRIRVRSGDHPAWATHIIYFGK